MRFCRLASTASTYRLGDLIKQSSALAAPVPLALWTLCGSLRFSSSKILFHERGTRRQRLSFLTNAHFPSVLLFLQMLGVECRHPNVWVSVSSSDNGRH